MSWQDVLDAATLREIFDRDIAPTLSAGGTVTLHPRLVFVGAQPGAGKSRSIADVQDEYPDATAIIGDDFRAFHPDYWELMESDPLAMPAVTAHASGNWVGMSAEYLRQERRSVILETTMRQHDVVAQTAAAFRDSGYRAEVRALAVPKPVSLLGTVSRYLGAGEGADRNRWTPSHAHTAAYSAMPDTIERLVSDGAVDRITVLTRSQHVLYDRTIDNASAVTVAGEARRAVDAGRAVEAMNPAEGAHWIREYLSAATTISKASNVPQDLRDTMTVLAHEAPTIIRTAYEPSEQPPVLDVVHQAAQRLATPTADGHSTPEPASPITLTERAQRLLARSRDAAAASDAVVDRDPWKSREPDTVSFSTLDPAPSREPRGPQLS